MERRQKKVVRAIRSKNLSVLAAVAKCGMLKYNIEEIAYNQRSFRVFIEDLLILLSEKGITNAKIVMDNAPAHKENDLKDLVSASGHELLFLPAYSPQLNPIEEVFSKWKSIIKSNNCNTKEQLFEVIHNSLNSISENDCLGYYRHTREYAVKGVRREEF